MYSINTTLNPLFSEEEIASKANILEQWQKLSISSLDELSKKEKEEIEVHQKSGKDKLNFKPSEDLLNIILAHSMALVCGRNAKKDRQKMIESNIAIINGEPIEKIEKAYWDQTSGIPYDNLGILDNGDVHLDDRELKEMYESLLKHRKDFWRDRRDYILSKNFPL